MAERGESSEEGVKTEGGRVNHMDRSKGQKRTQGEEKKLCQYKNKKVNVSIGVINIDSNRKEN